jgi:RNA polymerase sigma factor (sigma-70 family)
VARLLARYQDAWQQFVDAHYSPLMHFVQRQLQIAYAPVKTQDLEDVLAEVFAAIVQNDFAALRSFQFRCRLSTWLMVLAKRACWKLIKRNQRFRQPGLGLASEHEILSQLEAPLLNQSDPELLVSVKRQLSLLEEPDRRLLEMHYFESLDYDSIAKRLGLSVNSIGPKLHRAHARLKRLMEKS